MKKSTLIIVALFIGAISVNAQGQFRAGANGGIPVGDASDLTTFNIAIELGYLFEIDENFKAGPSTGVVNFFGDNLDVGGTTVEVEDELFIPVGGTARYSPFENFWFGADIGYAIGASEGNDGGFYYKPHVLYNFGILSATLNYINIALDGFTLSAITAGVEFAFD